MSKTNEAYWKEREEKQEKKNAADDKKQIAKIEKIYQQQEAEIEQQVLAFYAKYADKNGLDIAEVKKRCSLLDIDAYEKKAKEYVKNKDFSEKANEEMAIYNLTMKTSRLEMLKAEISLTMAKKGTEAEKAAAQAIYDTAMNEYSRQAGFMGKFLENPEKAARETVKASFHSGTFSDKIWKHQQALRNQLDKVISSGLIQGKNPREFISEIKKRHEVTTYQAERLLRTEFTRARSQATMDSFKATGVEEFVIVNGSSDRLCPHCSSLGGEHFLVKDGAVGDNIPPFHPNCRCSIAPYVDEKAFEGFCNSETDLEWEEYQQYGSEADAVDGKEKEQTRLAKESKTAQDQFQAMNDEYWKAKKNISRCKAGSAKYNEYKAIIDRGDALSRTAVSSAARSAELLKELETDRNALYKKRIDYFSRKAEEFEPKKTYSGIWKNDITLNDFLKISEDRIQAKKDYFLANKDANPTFETHLKTIAKLEKLAEDYRPVYEKLNDLKMLYRSPEEEKFSQERKDKAYWFTQQNGGTRGADGVLRPVVSEVWKNAPRAERKAIYDYTNSFSCINEPLRGIEYGTSVFKGIGNINFDTIGVSYSGYKKGEVREKIRNMTSIIEKCENPHDMWFTRGCRWGGMDKFFNADIDLLQYGSDSELQSALIGTTVTEYGFMSAGASKGKGFSDMPVCINIYAPKGSKYIWAEPFSAYGQGAQSPNWDGFEKQSSYGQEAEVVFQRGTQFKIAKIYRERDKLYVDLDLIAQEKEGPDV